MMLRDERQLTGNDRYEGFTIDLLRQLSDRCGFDYEIYHVDKYGSSLGDGQWNGMVGEVINGVNITRHEIWQTAQGMKYGKGNKSS